MSIFGNMLDAVKMGQDIFGGQNQTIANSFSGGNGGMGEIEQALMMQNLQNYQPNAQQGTMFGMPGAQQKSITVDEMAPAAAPATSTFEVSENNLGENAVEAFKAFANMFGGMMAGSDRRLKKNIEKIGRYNGHNVYRFDYVWDPDGTGRIGVMAQEVPHAASMHESGYLMVDYSKI